MKRLTYLIILVVMVLVGCKTNENNYRQAYEAAVSQRQEESGVDSTIYAKMRNSGRVADLVVDGVSMPMKSEYIGYTENGGASRETVKKYNVVAGQFRQVFNARQMRQRLIESGYDSAFIVHTREPMYYVVTSTFSTPEETLKAYQKVLSDKSIVLRAPLPFILRPSHFRQ
ncbi:MAG: SPOR domain-containing protein [Muribaculum sp.]|nr:SPOR domain-containing protein [Muribaculum sp.]